MLALLVIALALGGPSPDAARLLAGSVLDPGGLPVAGAEVSLRCSAAALATSTNIHGAFVFHLRESERECQLTVTARGFAPIDLGIDDRAPAPLIVRLQLPAHEEQLTVRGDLDAFHTPRSAVLEGALAREFVNDADAMMEYARALAGAGSDRAQVVVDGSRRTTRPAAARIDRVVVNADPYSAALAGLDGARVEVETAPLRPAWSYTATLSPGSFAGRHPLGAGHQMQTRSASAGIAGPLAPALAWSAGVSHTRREQELPLLSGLPGPTQSAEPVSSGDRTTHAFAAAAYESKTTRIVIDAAMDEVRLAGVGAGGLVWPEAASDGRARTVETHGAVRTKIGAATLRASGTVATIGRQTLARSDGRGTSMSGGAVGGGAAVSSDESRGVWTWWTVRAEGRAHGKPWLAGLELTTSKANESWVPNTNGALYLAPGPNGDGTSVALAWDRGEGHADVRTRAAGVYGEVQWLRTNRATINSGVRVDVASRDTPVVEPRVSASVRVWGGHLIGGAGRFVEEWSAETLLPLWARLAPGIEHLALDGACAEAAAGSGCEVLRGTASVAISRQRQTVASIGFTRAIRGLDLSGEYRRSASSHVPSLARTMTEGGWLETFGSGGHQRQDEIRTRAGFGPSARAVVAHYTWRHARETTDGWYGSPVPGTGWDAWAPAANLPRHEAGVVFSMRTGSGTSLSAVGSLASGRPVDLILSPRTLADLLTGPRRPGSRNAGIGPGYSGVSLYASQRIGLPLTRARGRVGAQVVNVLGRRNLLAPVTVVDSPLYGRATSAASGRAVGFWFTLEGR